MSLGPNDGGALESAGLVGRLGNGSKFGFKIPLHFFKVLPNFAPHHPTHNRAPPKYSIVLYLLKISAVR